MYVTATISDLCCTSFPETAVHEPSEGGRPRPRAGGRLRAPHDPHRGRRRCLAADLGDVLGYLRWFSVHLGKSQFGTLHMRSSVAKRTSLLIQFSGCCGADFCLSRPVKIARKFFNNLFFCPLLRDPHASFLSGSFLKISPLAALFVGSLVQCANRRLPNCVDIFSGDLSHPRSLLLPVPPTKTSSPPKSSSSCWVAIQ